MMQPAEFVAARVAAERTAIEFVPDWYCTDSARGEGWGSRGDCWCGQYMYEGTESATKDAFYTHLEDVHARTATLARLEAYERILARRERFAAVVAHHPMEAYSATYVTLGEVLIDLAYEWKSHPDWNPEWEVK